jgi:hypothetical protein
VHARTWDQELPDPTNGPGGSGLSLETSPGSGTVIVDGVTFTGPAFDAAAKTCGRLLPGGGGPAPPPTAQHKQQALEFAKCMRRHAVPNFPDPTFSTGGGAPKTASRLPGVKTNSPAFKQAVAECGGGTRRLG